MPPAESCGAPPWVGLASADPVRLPGHTALSPVGSIDPVCSLLAVVTKSTICCCFKCLLHVPHLTLPPTASFRPPSWASTVSGEPHVCVGRKGLSSD